MTSLFISWNVDPEILAIGPLHLRYYGILFALGFIVGYFIFKRFFRIENIPQTEIDKMSIYVIIGAILGARLGHVIFYEPEVYLQDPIQIFMVWKGGLASHGGAIGLLIALAFFARKSYTKSYLHILDRIAVPTALAGSFIRLGNLFNSEIYGHETSLPWGFIFVRNGETLPKHPTQIYEALCYVLIFVILLYMYNRRKALTPRGQLIGWFMILVFGMRFMIEFVKNPQVDFESGMFINMGQILSIPFVLAGIGLVWYSMKKGIVNENVPKSQKH